VVLLSDFSPILGLPNVSISAIRHNHLLPGLFPNSNRSADVDIETPDDAELRNFDALVDHLKVLDGDAFLLLAEKQDDRFAFALRGGKGKSRQADARRSLLEADNAVALLLAGTEPCKEVLQSSAETERGIGRPVSSSLSDTHSK